MNFLNEFVLLLKARYPIIYIATDEEERIEYLIKYCTKKYVVRTYYSWDFVDGYQANPNDTGFAARNPLEALDLIDKLTPDTPALFVLKDYGNFFKDFSIIRKLKNLSRNLKTQPKNIIIISSEVTIPDSLKEFVTLLEFPLPNYSEILEELNRLTASLQQKIEPTTLSNIATACQGLSLERIRRVLSKVIAKYGEINDSSPNLILQEKKQIIQQSQLLEFCLNDRTISDLGGLDNFKDWLKLRTKAFSQEAILYGLPYPKGLLLVGVQGTGKSIAAKIIADEWKLPLLRLDFGRLFASLIGQSEQRVRKMIEIAEALSPCVLWVDEIDKAFAGSQSSGDSGTTSRVLATFITWLSEKTSPVFVVATANNVDCIPPEILRKGRFDEMFFSELTNTRRTRSNL
jgi:SpoVK/Ycf46/Vps4 family AAA+-type ATPase